MYLDLVITFSAKIRIFGACWVLYIWQRIWHDYRNQFWNRWELSCTASKTGSHGNNFEVWMIAHASAVTSGAPHIPVTALRQIYVPSF